MKKSSLTANILKIILLILIISMLVHCKKIEMDKPVLIKGVMDLESYDFEKLGILSLSGECEFYWNKLYTPNDLKNIKPDSFRTIPNSWNNSSDKLPPFGYATYKMKIILGNNPVISLKIPNQDSAYKMWINGQIVSENGIVGKTKSETVPQRVLHEITVKNDTGTIEIIIQVSNFSHRWGGLGNKIEIGLLPQIFSNSRWYLAYQLFIIGAIFITMIYYLFVYMTRRNEISRILFVLFCFCILVRILFSNEYIIYQIFPGFNWELGMKFEFLSLYSSMITFFFFVSSLFRENIPKFFNRINMIILFLASLIVIIFPAYIFSIYTLFPIQLYTIICGMILIFFLAKTLILKKESVILIVFAGTIVLFIAFFADFLFSNEIFLNKFKLPFSMPFAPLGIVIYIYLHSIVLAINLSKTYNKLDDLTINLEREVNVQTGELITANNKLKEMDKAKTVFFTNLNHELRTPLTLILSPLDSIIKGHYGKSILNDDRLLKIILNNCYKLNKKVDDILDFIKIEENKMPLKKEPVVMNRLLRRYYDELDLLMKNKEMEFTYTCIPERDITCNVDVYLFETAFMNLISNAYKFTKRGGKISISLENDETCLILKISDTGIGIPPDKIDRIFDRFNNIEYLPGMYSYGSGLGLSLTKRIIELHEGDIYVSSIENKETCFTIRIPYTNSEQQLENNFENLKMTNLADFENQIIADEIPSDKNKFSILAIDDNIDVLNFLITGLKKDFNVFTADNVRKGLEILKEQKINLALSDLMMEPEDGWDFLNYLNSDPQYRNIPVIFLTAKNLPEDRIGGLQKGAIDYITKPFLLDELILKIDNILKRETKIKKDFQFMINKALDTDNNTAVMDDITENIYKNKNISAREQEIIQLLISGHQYKEIEVRLGISINTVTNHISNIYNKLGIHNKVELLNLFKK
jgi:two-component system, sensor histidine kinase ChiS